MHHTSVGDLLRAQAAAGTLPPALAEKHVRHQQLMDGAAITAVLESSGVLRREEGEEEKGRVVVLDGFPRNMDQLLAFAARVSTCFFVFSLECGFAGVGQARVPELVCEIYSVDGRLC